MYQSKSLVSHSSKRFSTPPPRKQDAENELAGMVRKRIANRLRYPMERESSWS